MNIGSNLSLGPVMGAGSQRKGLNKADARLPGTIFSGAVSSGRSGLVTSARGEGKSGVSGR